MISLTKGPNRRQPTRKEMQVIIDRQAAKIAYLEYNPDFGCITRRGLDLILEDMPLVGLAAVFWDVDGMKRLNEDWGKPEINHRIKLANAARVTDCVAGQVFSGDEFIAFPLLEDAGSMAYRIQSAYRNYGMTATIIVTRPYIIETPKGLLDRVDDLCSLHKDAGRRNMVHIEGM